MQLFSQPQSEVEVSARISKSGKNIYVEYTIPSGYHLFKSQFLDFTAEGVQFSDPLYFDKNSKITEDSLFYQKLTIKKDIQNRVSGSVVVLASFQLCSDEGVCYFPSNREIVLQTKTKSSGLFTKILLALLAGILLNFSPCILPILGVKLLTLASFSEKSGSSKAREITSYSFGVLSSFFVLAIAAVFVRMAGKTIGWGFQFQNRYYTLFATTMIFVFALVFLKVLTLPNLTNSGFLKKSTTSSFFMGLVAVMLGSACSVPLLGGAAAFALSQTSFTIFLIFLTIGIGFCLPIIFLGIFPPMTRVLSKIGVWSPRLYKVFGLTFLAVSVWLLSIARYQIEGIKKVILVFVAVVIVAMVKKARWLKSKKWQNALLVCIVVLLVLPFVFVQPTNSLTGSKTQSKTSDLQTPQINVFYSTKELDSLVQNSKNLFVEVSAKWCISCSFNRATVLENKKIKEFFKTFQIKHIVLDYTNASEEITSYIATFGTSGVPVYVLYRPEKKPLAITGYLFVESFLETLTKHYKKF